MASPYGNWIVRLRRLMDQDTFTKITVVLHQLHGSASAVASFVLAPLMLAGVVFGCLLTRWIFSGGLSRSVFRVRDCDDSATSYRD